MNRRQCAIAVVLSLGMFDLPLLARAQMAEQSTCAHLVAKDIAHERGTAGSILNHRALHL